MAYADVLKKATEQGYSEAEVRAAVEKGVSKAFLRAHEEGVPIDKLKGAIAEAGVPEEIYSERPGQVEEGTRQLVDFSKDVLDRSQKNLFGLQGHIADMAKHVAESDAAQKAAQMATLPGRGNRALGVGIERILAGDKPDAVGDAAMRALQPGYAPQDGEKLGAFAGGSADPLFLAAAGGLAAPAAAGAAAMGGGAVAASALEAGGASAVHNAVTQMAAQGKVDPKDVALAAGLGGATGAGVTAASAAIGRMLPAALEQIRTELNNIQYGIKQGMYKAGIPIETGLVPYNVKAAMVRGEISEADAAAMSVDFFKEAMAKRGAGMYAEPTPGPQMTAPPEGTLEQPAPETPAEAPAADPAQEPVAPDEEPAVQPVTEPSESVLGPYSKFQPAPGSRYEGQTNVSSMLDEVEKGLRVQQQRLEDAQAFLETGRAGDGTPLSGTTIKKLKEIQLEARRDIQGSLSEIEEGIGPEAAQLVTERAGIKPDRHIYAALESQAKTPRDAALFRALHSVVDADARFADLRRTGVTDTQLKEFLGRELGIEGGGSGGPGTEEYWYKGGKNPQVEIGGRGKSAKTTIKGQKLLDETRRLLDIPKIEEPETAKKGKATPEPEAAAEGDEGPGKSGPSESDADLPSEPETPETERTAEAPRRSSPYASSLTELANSVKAPRTVDHLVLEEAKSMPGADREEIMDRVLDRTVKELDENAPAMLAMVPKASEQQLRFFDASLKRAVARYHLLTSDTTLPAHVLDTLEAIDRKLNPRKVGETNEKHILGVDRKALEVLDRHPVAKGLEIGAKLEMKPAQMLKLKKAGIVDVDGRLTVDGHSAYQELRRINGLQQSGFVNRAEMVKAPKPTLAKFLESIDRPGLLKTIEEGWVTDGKIMFRANEVLDPILSEFAKKAAGSGVNLEPVIKQSERSKDRVVRVAGARKGNGKTEYLLETAAGDRLVIDGSYYEFLKDRFPEARWYAGGKDQPLRLAEGKRTVAAAMPLRYAEPKLLDIETGKEIPPAPKSEELGGGGGGSSAASKGAFSTEVETGVSGSVPQEAVPEIKAFRMPEMVKLAKELMGDVPGLKKFQKAYGMFYGRGRGEIKLDPRIFTDPRQAAKTLAHEIGHLIDYLPDHMLRRGNLVGRLNTLQRFMQSTYGESAVTNSEVRTELKAVTQYWKPFDENGVPASYRQYRYSSVELYADAISVLLNSPGTLEKMAPKFYKGFFEGLDRKPDVKEAFFGLMRFLNQPEDVILSQRRVDLRESFAKGEELFKQKRAEKELQDTRIWERFRQELDDKNYSILHRLDELEKTGVLLPAERNPRYLLEEMTLADNANHVMLARIEREVEQPLAQAEISRTDVGEYMMMRRIAEGDRSDIANPLGYTPEEARKALERLNSELGPEIFSRLEQAVNRFHDIVFEVNQQAVEVGAYSKKNFEELIVPNKYSYATFAVLDHLDEFIPSTIRKQTGTFKDIANPYTATIMKTMTVNRLIAYQRAKNAFRDTWLEHFPDEISKAAIRNPMDKLKQFREEKGMAHLVILEDGKPQAYNVDPFIAAAFEKGKAGQLSVAVGLVRALNSKALRPVWITMNLGFGFVTNPVRDFARTWKLNPNATLRQLVLEYARSFPSALRRARGVPDPLIEEMIGNKALDVSFFDLTLDQEADQYTHLLKRMGIVKEQAGEASGIKKLLSPLVQLGHAIRTAGSAIETLPKVAGYNIRKASGEIGEQLAYNTRNYTGTPNIRRRGTLTSTSNEVFLFSNIIKEDIKTNLEIAANPKTRGAYVLRTAWLNLLPKLALFAAAAGLAGEAVKETVDRIPEYDKINSIPIPLGTYEGGKTPKTVYIKVPQDDFGRVAGGIFWKLLNHDRKTGASIVDQVSNMFPGVTSVVTVPYSWGQFLQGKNPYDSFRGRPVINDTEFKAGEWPALKSMVRWTFDQMGASNFGFAHVSPDASPVEASVARIPVLNRLLKISDRGLQEQDQAAIDATQQQKAELRLERLDNAKAFASERSRLLEKKQAGILTSQDQRRLLVMNSIEPMVRRVDEGISLATKRGNLQRAQTYREQLERVLERVNNIK
jgi:hypothetical protein